MQVPVGLSLTATTKISVPGKVPFTAQQVSPGAPGGSAWNHLLQQAMGELNQLVKLEHKVGAIDSKLGQLTDPSLRQGLQLQITVQNLGLRVELYSKCLDGVSSAIKRLQQPS